MDGIHLNATVFTIAQGDPLERRDNYFEMNFYLHVFCFERFLPVRFDRFVSWSASVQFDRFVLSSASAVVVGFVLFSFLLLLFFVASILFVGLIQKESFG